MFPSRITCSYVRSNAFIRFTGSLLTVILSEFHNFGRFSWCPTPFCVDPFLLSIHIIFFLSHCLSLLTKLLALPIDGVCDVAAKNRNETLVYGFTFFFSIMGSGCNIASFFLFFLVVSMSAICRIFILLQSLLVVCCSILKNKTTFLG